MKRRTLIFAGSALTAGAVTGLQPAAARDDELKPLTGSEPAAQALHYVEDSANADPAYYEQGSGHQCASCRHYQGGDKPRGGCALFPGHSVSAKGWCAGWVSAGPQARAGAELKTG